MPPKDSESPLALGQQRELLKPEDFILEPAVERRLIGRFKRVSEEFMKDKNFAWAPEEFAFATSCALAYSSAFQARGVLAETISRRVLNMDSAADCNYDAIEKLQLLQTKMNRLSTSIITHNIFEMLTNQGLDVTDLRTGEKVHKDFDEQSATKFIGSIARNVMSAYSTVVLKAGGVGVFPTAIDPVTGTTKPLAMLVNEIKLSSVGETVKARDLLAQLNAMEAGAGVKKSR